jgi:RNA polymerase sigma factor (sigma-70 family)
MKLDTMPEAETLDDAHLVELGLDDDRHAFGQLVARYQSPVCALAFSACGDISQSEDLAQETFIIAWRKLSDLKEPAKFKSWLYGIARNLINNTLRQQIRNPLATAQPLDENLPATATVSNPASQAISKEEEGILWRSLEHIPEAYREPLILFYREHQSVERVAAALDLSEEAARQRLSRGRKLLQERVIAFVEGALGRTAPSKAFTLSVMAVLPNLPVAAGSSAIGGGMTGKTAATGFVAAFKGVLIKFLPAVFFTFVMTQVFPESKRERKFALKAYFGLWIIAFLYPAVLLLCGYLGRHYWDAHPQRFDIAVLASTFGFVAIIGPYTGWIARVQNRIRKQAMEQSPNPHAFSFAQPYEYRSSRTFLGLPLLHVRWHCVKDGKTLPAIGWMACGNKAYGILFASGQIAVACVSMGVLSIGLFAVGAFGIGGFAFGGMALGIMAMGGAAIGYLAFGGGAIGWLGASGGATLARHFALGGGAIAEHPNDKAAWSFMHSNLFFSHTGTIFNILILICWLAPSGLMFYYKRRRERKTQAAQAAR